MSPSKFITNEVNRIGRDAEGQDEARICAPEFWVPKADLKQSAKNFAWAMLICFCSWCLFRGLYVTVQDVRDFLRGLGS